MHNPIISIIAAIDEKGGIGKDNSLPWNIPEDMKHFAETTAGHVVIMGRKTFESILKSTGKPLPNRTNIVITRKPKYTHKDIIVVSSLSRALKEAKKTDDKEIYIIGGGEIYKQGMKYADKLRISYIKGDYGCDTFFPQIDLQVWKKKKEINRSIYSYIEYIRV